MGVSNLHVYAAMRGETLEEFQKTRNAPGALYSVAGSEAESRDALLGTPHTARPESPRGVGGICEQSRSDGENLPHRMAGICVTP